MRNILYLLVISFFVFSCSDSNEEEKVNLSTFKDKLSYSLGADHARSISESGDPNFGKYNLDKMVQGFEIGIKDKSAFDDACKNTLKNLFSSSGKSINEKYLEEGSLCIGKLSGTIFKDSWTKNKGIDKLDLKKIIVGFKHGIQKRDTLIKREEQSMMIQNFMFDIYKINGINMVEEAKKLSNTQITPNGVVVQTLKEGNGAKPSVGDDVLAHYILMNSSGDTLQSSFDLVEKYGQPLTAFSLSSVIPGWQEGIPYMKKGGTYKLYIPFHLAYGEQGMYNPQSKKYDILPFQSLMFYIQLLNVGKPGSLTK